MGSRASAALFAIVAACGGGGAPPPTGPIDATVLRYDVSFDLTTRHAKAIVTAHVNVAGDCLTLPFRAKNLANLTIDGMPAGGQLADGQLTACGPGHDAGDELELGAEMDVAQATLGPSQVGYSVTTAAGGQLDYLVSWIEGCDQFAPCDHRPSAFATYHFHVTHPAGVTVLCPGTITDADGVTDCTFDFAGGPTYSGFGLAAMSTWTAHDLGTWAGGVHATIYDEPAGKVTAQVDPAYLGGFLQWMIDRFGPYPYGGELRYAVAPTYWSGFEHPGNIVLDDGLVCTSPSCASAYLHPVAHVMMHETAHQWAGDQTTLAGRYDFVWKEAAAEYLAYAYEAQTDPPAALATARAWKSLAVSARYYPVPTTMPALFDYYGDVYGPGPMILFHQIEGLSSRDQVIAGLRAVLGHPDAIGVADVEAALEQSTGLDLQAYFAAWMTGAGAPVWPTFQATWIPAPQPPGGVLEVSETNAAAAGAKTCAFEVELRDAAGTSTLRVPIDTFRGTTDQSITISDPGFAVASVVLDPDATCLVFPAGTAFAPHAPGWSPWRSRAR